MCITFAGSDIKLLGNQLQVLPIKIEEQKHHGGARGGSFLSLSLSLAVQPVLHWRKTNREFPFLAIGVCAWEREAVQAGKHKREPWARSVSNRSRRVLILFICLFFFVLFVVSEEQIVSEKQLTDSFLFSTCVDISISDTSFSLPMWYTLCPLAFLEF